MKAGKLPNSMLNRIILGKIKNKRSDILIPPGVGEDTCALDFGEYACVLTCDPITGTAKEIGRLAVHISCNDVASAGVEPIGLMVTILAPVGTTEEEFEKVMTELCETAFLLNVDILGGHTEISSAVNRFTVITTAVGKGKKERLISTSGARVGDDILLTKAAGLEGTAVIAHEKEDELRDRFGPDFVQRAKGFVNSISVVPEGILCGKLGVNAMHDVTEGGILGAVWELSEACGWGVEVWVDQILVEPETQEICKHFNISPYKLISSGAMLITCEDGNEVVKKLEEKGIKASVIGKVTADNRKISVWNGTSEEILEPDADELYRVV